MKKEKQEPLENTINLYKKASYNLKSKTNEFLGVAREFSYFQEDMLSEFKRIRYNKFFTIKQFTS